MVADLSYEAPTAVSVGFGTFLGLEGRADLSFYLRDFLECRWQKSEKATSSAFFWLGNFV
ncbi:hypothetical protein AciX9_3436 [Granulicella tundricola MP5ACTX9]|uniref:Uncharacterized protein n=2 Tax=Granulicella TaxID=940557 RepID=E8X3E0_GRATM|nr:hypothetical protein AciX9_3436 [Granulicella tundricola MP5ACTX9]